MAIKQVDNSIYEELGDRWYTAYDDPIALLRAENKVKTPWIVERIRKNNLSGSSVLDVGCGAGFLSNELARQQFKVTGVDLSPDSLRVARKFDETHTVDYQVADAYQLPFADETFEVVTALDFLEHVDDPALVIKEFSRVLKPGGLFFFHTFNRSPLTHLVVIKLVEWLVKNTPKDMHVIDLFITPKELTEYCRTAKMQVKEMSGIRPVFTSIPISSLFSGVVSKSMRFTLTSSLAMSYLGFAKKI